MHYEFFKMFEYKYMHAVCSHARYEYSFVFKMNVRASVENVESTFLAGISSAYSSTFAAYAVIPIRYSYKITINKLLYVTYTNVILCKLKIKTH